jgi:Fe-S oxidoreductase
MSGARRCGTLRAVSPVAFPIVLAAGLLVFFAIVAVRARALLRAQPSGRLDRWPERLKNAIVYGVGQKKFFRGEQPAGIMHALIFWGFLVLMLQVLTLYVRAFDEDFSLPADDVFGVARDAVEVLVAVAVVYMLYRRLVVHTPRLFGLRRAEERYRAQPHWEGVLILVFILLIVGGGFLYDHAGSTVAWWVHNTTVLVFLCVLPLTKHFHIITAIPNLFVAKLPSMQAERPLAIDHAPPAPVAALKKPPDGKVGVASLADLNWKQVLDAYTCTECGRCSAVCPATASGTPLAPRQLILDLRAQLYHVDGEPSEPPIPEDVLWSCTTCMACVEACPVGIEHVPTIVDMRRTLVDRGEMDPLLQQTLQNFGMQGNSQGKSARMRARWTKGLDFKIPDARKEPVEYVWFVGDFASFDERAQETSRTVARLLHDAGVSFGLLYEGERNSGNDVRRIGEEGLFEMLVEQNMAAFADADFEAIFTTDPHSLNTLRNEYPEFGLMKPVYHYTELFADLVARGVLSLTTPLSGLRVTYHDPCYLARYNRITDAPRRLIEATGAELVEMPRHGVETFCCGAGGGRMWMMDGSETQERPSEQRIREAQTLGRLDFFLVSCPKDLAMYSDAVKVVGADFEVAELTVLIERALASAHAEPVAAR